MAMVKNSSEIWQRRRVKEWAGHADERTTMQFYLQVSESEYDKAAGLEKE